MPGGGLGASQEAHDVEDQYHRSLAAGVHGDIGDPVGKGALGRGRGRGIGDQDEEAIMFVAEGEAEAVAVCPSPSDMKHQALQ
jgi:hypothetical protein